MEVVPLQAPAQYLNDPRFSHLLLNVRVLAYVQQYVQRYEQQLVLLPYQNVQLLQLSFRCNLVFLIIPPPHLNVLAVQQVKPLNLVLHHIYHSFPNLLFSHVLLELSVVRQNVKHTQQVHAQVDIAFVVLGQCTTQHLQQRF